MSNGDADESDADAGANGDATDGNGDAAEDESAESGVVADLESRLDDAAEALEAAETEADLDDVEARLDEVEQDLADADLPEPDEDEEDAEDPAAALEERLDGLQEDLEDARGPYAADVAETVREGASTLSDAEWTDEGAADAVAAVESFVEDADDEVDTGVGSVGEAPADAADALEDAADAIEDAGLDADDDAETIAALLEAAEALTDDLEAAETWDDLTVREQLQVEGWYEPLTAENRKDFPPEWTVIKAYAAREEVEPLVTALDRFESDFIEDYVFDQLQHLGSAAAPAFDVLHDRAEKRNEAPIEILGKIGDERAAETLHEFVESDGDPGLQQVTVEALGRIGSEDSTEAVAQALATDHEGVRSTAARALGMIGDTRAVSSLEDVLADDDESDTVRASAAWALRQIGTEDALDAAAEYADDRAYLVQAEAEKATGA